MISGYSEDNVKTAWSYWREKGLNDFAIAGIMANWYVESKINPKNLQNSGNRKLGLTDEQYTAAVDNGTYTNFALDRIGYGICQWTSSGRKQNMLNYCKQSGSSIGDLLMQLGFMWQELTTSYKSVLKVLQNAKSVDEAARVVMLKFERPKNQSEANQLVRVGYGLEFYEKYATKEVTKEVETMSRVNVYSKQKDGNTKLSDNFKVRELACKDGSDPIFIDPELAEVLQKIRDYFGKPVTINSGFRTASYNKKVGGAPYSQHLYGKAADIKVRGVKPKQVAAFAATLLPNRGGIGIYANFTHIDVRAVKSRWNG